MKKCNYTFYNENGEMFEFGSSAELDYFLFNNYAEIAKKSASIIKYSLESTSDKIDRLSKKLKSQISSVEERYDPLFEGVETVLKIKDSIGANRFIDEVKFNNKHLVTPFNQKEYFDEIGINGDSEAIITGGWKNETDVGTVIHKIAEIVMSGSKESVKLNELFGDDNDRNNWLNTIYTSFDSLKFELKEKHGENCKIYTELPIISNELPEPYSNVYKTINGRIDLLVIDEKGNAHIYDYKISKKSPGKWNLSNNNAIIDEWPSTKKLKIEYQLEIYRAILQQHGINVSSVNIIPIKVKYNSSDLTIGDKVFHVSKSLKSFSVLDIINDSNGIKRRTEKVSEIVPVKYLTDNIDGIKAIVEPMSVMFNGYDLSTKIEISRASFDKIKSSVHTVAEDDSDRAKGKYWFYNKFKTKNNGRVYCKDDAELNEKINEYVQKINEESAQGWAYISQQLQAISDGSQEYDSLSLKTASRDENEYMRRLFSKFLNNPNGKNWKYQKNDTLSAAGIFVFTNDNGVAEIVVLTEQEINQEINLGKGKSLLGTDKKDYEVDEHIYLTATNGRLNIMKAICMINYASENFKGYRINSISAHNTRTQQGVEEDPDIMWNIFKDAAKLHKDKVDIKIDDSYFSNTLQYVEAAVESLCSENLMKLAGVEFAYGIDDIVIGLEKLERIRESLYSKSVVYNELNSGNPNFNIPEVLAYNIVMKAIAKLKGYRVYHEANPAPFLNTKGGPHAGLNVTSSELSPSLNFQQVGKITANAGIIINQKTVKTSNEIKSELDDLYKSKDRNKLVGYEVRYFDNLFRLDGTGNKDPRFLLKKETDQSLSKEEKAFILKFLKIVNNFKFNGDQAKIAEIRYTDEYYEVPLAMGRGWTTFHNMSFGELVKQNYNEALNFLNIFDSQQSDLNVSRKQYVAYNKYKIGSDTRKKLLNDTDINKFETHLGILILDIINTYHKEEVYNDILPQIQGLKIALQYQQKVLGNDTQNILDAIDKYVDINMFSKPIMDLQPIYKLLSAVRSVTGATVLGFNMRSGIRELMQGMWNHLSRSMVQMYGKGMFNHADILKAWTIVFKLSLKDPNMVTLLDAVNAEYGMANADVDSIKDLLNQSKSGVLNFGSDTMYIFNRIPDAYHRMGILIAQMLHDGCWDAHSQDENGMLIYDFTKDKRFDLLNNPNSNINSEEYKSQLDLYLSMVDQFRIEGYNIPHFVKGKKIPPLPRAYTIQEGLSIKSFADLCFGHYDKRTQMLAKHMFLGSFFLQFRTFLSAKLEQWILKPGTYNIGSYREKFDVDGVRIMRVISFDDNGIPKVELKREDEISKEDIATPYKEWQGRFMEGIAYSMWDFGHSLVKMNSQDLKELWKNDTKRANLFLFINDMILMSIIMAAIQALLLDNEEIEWNPGTHMMAMALYTSFSDGPITQLLSSLGGDINPPMYSQVKNLYRNSVNVLTGDMKISEYFTGTFGALRDLEYLMK